jgi:hypothetical protein
MVNNIKKKENNKGVAACTSTFNNFTNRVFCRYFLYHSIGVNFYRLIHGWKMFVGKTLVGSFFSVDISVRKTNSIKHLWAVVHRTKLLICQLQFPAPDCERRVKCSDITCWIYSAHIFFEMYGNMKSFQIVMSF